MDLWNRICGTLLLEITAADPERLLNCLTRDQIEVWDVNRKSQLQIRFRIRRKALPSVEQWVQKSGGEIEVIGAAGLFYRMRSWKKRPLILVCILILSALTLILQEMILFVDVEGNDSIPRRMILEAAQRQGLCFGADRRALRSEELKNALLHEIKSLEWVGVNTNGCRAVICVRERESEPESSDYPYSSLIAASDAIVERIVMNRGNLLCREGQAVSKGDVLVSGFTDLGICSRAVAAQAEIYGLTLRPVGAVLPAEYALREETTRQEIRISLIFGKKRINLYSDSGILPPGCGKMTYSLPLKLPGGDVLPFRLVICRILWYNTRNMKRSESEADNILHQAAQRAVLEDAVSGQILTRQTQVISEPDLFVLEGKLQCREMIARSVTGVILEGDTKDDSQNSQRGAG